MTQEEIKQLIDRTQRGGSVAQAQMVAMLKLTVEHWQESLRAIVKALEPSTLWQAKTIAPSLFGAVEVAWSDPENPAAAGSRATTTVEAMRIGVEIEDWLTQKVIPGPKRLASNTFLSVLLRSFSLTPKVVEKTKSVLGTVWDGAKLLVGQKLLNADAALLLAGVLDNSSAAKIKNRWLSGYWALQLALHTGAPFPQTEVNRYRRKIETRVEVQSNRGSKKGRKRRGPRPRHKKRDSE